MGGNTTCTIIIISQLADDDLIQKDKKCFFQINNPSSLI